MIRRLRFFREFGHRSAIGHTSNQRSDYAVAVRRHEREIAVLFHARPPYLDADLKLGYRTAHTKRSLPARRALQIT